MATAIGIAVLLVITLHPRAPAGAACGRAGPVHLDDAGQLAVAATRPLAPPLPGGVARAYQFLDQMMDLRTTGPARRLVQSYTGGLLGQRGDTSASSYDNALLIDAYLAEGTPGGVARAKTIGGALVYLQAHDRAHDGRLRNGYAPVPLHAANDIQVTDPASSTGTLAWAGAGPRPALRGHPDPGLPAERDRAGRLDPVAVPGRARGRAATPAATPRPGPRSDGS